MNINKSILIGGKNVSPTFQFLPQNDQDYLNILRETSFLKESTKQIYEKNLLKIRDIVCNGSCSIEYILNHPETFLDKIKSFTQSQPGRVYENMENSSENFIKPIIALFQYHSLLKETKDELYKKWIVIRSSLKEKSNEHYSRNEPSERQRDAYVTYEEVVQIRDNLQRGSFGRLLLSLYTYLPPERSDHTQTRLFENCNQEDQYFAKTPHEKNKANYIVLNDCSKRGEDVPLFVQSMSNSSSKKYHPRKFIVETNNEQHQDELEQSKTINNEIDSIATLYLNTYKTSGRYGQIAVNLPNSLRNEILDSLSLYPRNYLFISPQTLEKFQHENSFNKWANRELKKIFRKDGFSLNMLRHIFITRHDLGLEKLSGKEQQSVAKLMGHSYETQRKYSFFSWAEKERQKFNDKNQQNQDNSENVKTEEEEDHLINKLQPNTSRNNTPPEQDKLNIENDEQHENTRSHITGNEKEELQQQQIKSNLTYNDKQEQISSQKIQPDNNYPHKQQSKSFENTDFQTKITDKSATTEIIQENHEEFGKKKLEKKKIICEKINNEHDNNDSMQKMKRKYFVPKKSKKHLYPQKIKPVVETTTVSKKKSDLLVEKVNYNGYSILKIRL